MNVIDYLVLRAKDNKRECFKNCEFKRYATTSECSREYFKEKYGVLCKEVCQYKYDYMRKKIES